METRETPQPLRSVIVSGAARFGPLLRSYRLAAGLTLHELAQRTGLSRRAISALELGYRRAPRTRTLERLANALGLDPETRAAFIAAGRGALILLPRAQPGPGLVPMPMSVDATLPTAALAPVPDMPEKPLHNLPLPPTPLLGREREVAEVTALVRGEGAGAGTRLITLTGPGGVGKIRLALEAAWTLQQQARDIFPDGVWFVRLAPLTDPALVIATIAQALGLREAGGASLADLLRVALCDQSLLLVLDNFEQVAAAAPHLAELLESSAGVRVLVTSRARLRLRGERAYPVALLAVPPRRHGRVVAEQLDQYAETALFVDRARTVRPDFPVTDASAPLIADICARLNGLPLGIELAATWARLLSPAALLAQLDRQLPLLAAGPVDVPARHQTMRAAIAWSYDLLDAESQRLFGRLAVFADGWTVDAAKVVCQTPRGVAPLRLDILTGLGELLDQSLISQRVREDLAGERAGEWAATAAAETPRLEMLHVVREFALERLEASGEAETLRRAHAHDVLTFAEEAELGLRGPDDIAWMQLVERELGNVRAALAWARAAGEAEIGLRLATALWRFWSEAGYLSEGQQWVETLLALAPPEAADAAEEAREARPQASSSIPTWLRARALTTIALQAGSPAIDAIPTSYTLPNSSTPLCPATDQRGVTRPATGETSCDMGAYETNYDDDLALTNMPQDITVNATSSSGAVVTYTTPTATDEGGDTSTPSVSCSPASGSTFAVSTTTVKCMASDGDDTPNPVSASFTVTVIQLPTTTTLTSSPNPSVVGQEVTYTAMVNPAPDGGSVKFYQNGSSIPIACGSDSQGLSTRGTATCTVIYSSVGTGTYHITASYSGDTNYASSSTASALTQTVNKASTTTGLAVTSPAQPSGLTAGSAVAVAGKTATLTATITVNTSGSGTPTGAVTFTDGTTTLCSNVPLSSSGMATCAKTFTAVGKHSITASYSGDTNYLSSAASLTLYVDTDISKYLQNGVYNLSNVNLSSGYFVGESLSGANLTNGNFSNANFTGANLANANLTQTNLISATGLAAGQLGGVTWFKTTCPDNTNSSNDGGSCIGHL